MTDRTIGMDAKAWNFQWAEVAAAWMRHALGRRVGLWGSASSSHHYKRASVFNTLLAGLQGRERTQSPSRVRTGPQPRPTIWLLSPPGATGPLNDVRWLHS